MGGLVTWALERAAVLLEQQLPRRWSHVQGVANRARVAAALFDVADQDLLVAAAVLHDVGYSPEIDGTGFHSLDGARALRVITANTRLVSLVAHHSCARREAELRGLSIGLAEWVDEKTPLRDALWWADMTTSPDGVTVSFDHRITEIQERYGPHDLVTTFIRQAEPELRAAVDRTEARLQASRIL